MKHLLSFTALLISSLAMGQFPNLPYNPDENGDGLIGVSDLQSLLSVYSLPFMVDGLNQCYSDDLPGYDPSPADWNFTLPDSCDVLIAGGESNGTGIGVTEQWVYAMEREKPIVVLGLDNISDWHNLGNPEIVSLQLVHGDDGTSGDITWRQARVVFKYDERWYVH